MTLLQIQERLLERVRAGVHNGEWTERGFARSVGISQAHVNKVLKGTRNLSPENTDLILNSLHCSVLDLYTEGEIALSLSRRPLRRPAAIETAVTNCAGPGLAWNAAPPCGVSCAVPCSLFAKGRTLKVAYLGPDPEMSLGANGACYGALDTASTCHAFAADGIYAVDRLHDTVLRYVRRGRQCLYLVTDRNRDLPVAWEVIRTEDRYGPIRGKLVWTGS